MTGRLKTTVLQAGPGLCGTGVPRLLTCAIRGVCNQIDRPEMQACMMQQSGGASHAVSARPLAGRVRSFVPAQPVQRQRKPQLRQRAGEQFGWPVNSRRRTRGSWTAVHRALPPPHAPAPPAPHPPVATSGCLILLQWPGCLCWFISNPPHV